MAFERQATITAVAVGRIETTLNDPDPDDDVPKSAITRIEVKMSDGSFRYIHADIADHFSPTVLNQLIAFVTAVRAKAEAEILPE